MEFLSSPAFWVALGQIIIIDILLGGDNAVVIALACRNLPAKSRRQGIFWGAAGAIILRVILITVAVALLNLPLLKLVDAGRENTAIWDILAANVRDCEAGAARGLSPAMLDLHPQHGTPSRNIHPRWTTLIAPPCHTYTSNIIITHFTCVVRLSIIML